MANIILEDGAGNGYKARVTSEKRLSVYAVVDSSDRHHAIDGNAFFIGTGAITLTGSGTSCLMFMKNNEDLPVIIDRIIAFTSASYTGTPENNFVLYKNPTTGSIVHATAIAAVNRNFGSTSPFDFTSYKGAEGDTVTDGIPAYAPFYLDYGRKELIKDKNIVLPRNASLALTVTPPPGNTAMKVSIGIAGWVDHLFDQEGTRA